MTLKVGWGGFYESAADKKTAESMIIDTLLESDSGFAEFRAEVEKASPKKVEKKAAKGKKEKRLKAEILKKNPRKTNRNLFL